MNYSYIPTGNEWASLPTIREQTAELESFSFLHMSGKGLIEQRGDDKTPLMKPFFIVNDKQEELSDLHWRRRSFWIPEFEGSAGQLQVKGTILSPIDERGFIYRLQICNLTEHPVDCTFGLMGLWASSIHCVNEEKKIDGQFHCYRSLWNDGIVFDMRCGLPLFSFAPMADVPCKSSFEHTDRGVQYRLAHDCRLACGESSAVAFFWGVGFEEVSSATSAKEMLRQGWEYELKNTEAWLEKRSYRISDSKLEEFYNLNLFFCLFYSMGRTLDTEELVLVTSRSPRYYVSAAYWDRDSLLWSFPSVLDADSELARQMLEYVFGRQRRNIGVHSRYIDGTVLEPGFELDELLAPVLALERYINATGDRDYLNDRDVQLGINEILRKLKTKRHGNVALYETFLQPTDDPRSYPYLTYNNVLVWRGLRAIAGWFPNQYAALESEAELVSEAIWENCVAGNGAGKYFVWSTDLNGNSDVYDEPPGSLLLLPYIGFCNPRNDVYRNTVKQIRASEYMYSFSGCEFEEIGCAHAPHPWLLSVGNSLLSGEVDRGLSILTRAELDNGIVCESIDEHTGCAATGEAFATCAGFVCHALRYALGGVEYEKRC